MSVQDLLSISAGRNKEQLTEFYMNNLRLNMWDASALAGVVIRRNKGIYIMFIFVLTLSS